MDLPQKLLDRTCERRPAASRLSPFVRGTIRAIFPIVPLTKGDSREAAGGRSHVRSNSFCCHPFVHTFINRRTVRDETLVFSTPPPAVRSTILSISAAI